MLMNPFITITRTTGGHWMHPRGCFRKPWKTRGQHEGPSFDIDFMRQYNRFPTVGDALVIPYYRTYGHADRSPI